MAKLSPEGKTPFSDITILNERPEGMPHEQYKLLRKLQKEMLAYYRTVGYKEPEPLKFTPVKK